MPLIGMALLSTVVPLGIFIGSNNIRASRQEIVRDLEDLFGLARKRKRGGDPLIIPAFERVKYEYDPNSNPVRERDANANSFRYYLIPVAIYIALSAMCFRMAFFKTSPLPNPFSSGTSVELSAAELQQLLAVLTYTFLGGYIWTIQYLIRRISNFDLSPLSFFLATTHILLGLFVTATIWQSGFILGLARNGVIWPRLAGHERAGD